MEAAHKKRYSFSNVSNQSFNTQFLYCSHRPSLKTEKSLDITLNQCTLVFVALVFAADEQSKTILINELSDQAKIIAFGLLTGAADDPCLEDIIVSADYRGKGAGKIIINQLIQHKAIEKAAKVELYCKYQLIGFYAQFGFELIRGKEGERCLLRLTRNKQQNSEGKQQEG
jgi:GNAT superfamily N-acetyltransferase